MTAETDRELLVYVGDCPACGREIKEPFARGSLVPYRHLTGRDRSDCRLVVLTDPIGDDHLIQPVPKGSGTLEEAMQKLEERYLGRFEQYAHLKAACDAAHRAA